ncbi:MAG: carbon starvation CstA family protein, partial [Gammaproteobacteria bacterium]
MKSLARAAFWIVATALGALAFGGIATARGEPINAWWLIAAAVCVYAIGYRVYGAWVATRVLLVDGRPMLSCLLPAADLEQRQITTIEGIDIDGQLHPLQQAMVE